MRRRGGKELLKAQRFLEAIYHVWEDPREDLLLEYQAIVRSIHTSLQHFRDAKHDITCALVKGFLNDWETIFRMLARSRLPLPE